MSEFVLKTEGLTKRFGKKLAVSNLNLEIHKGDIYGFVGKNGAGKTTAIRLISGLAAPTYGKIELFGSEKLQEGRKKIGALIETPALNIRMTARQNLDCQRCLLGIKNKATTEELLEVVGLADAGRKRIKNFSLGMKQRLAIAMALVGEPEFLILDEPTNGLDPIGIREIRNLILKLNQEAGITFLISSHIISELTKIATRYGVINDGVLIEQFTSEEFTQKIDSIIKISLNDAYLASEILKNDLGIENFEIVDENILILPNDLDRAGEINATLTKNGIIVNSISKEGKSEEEFFLNLMEGGKPNV